MIGIEVVKNRIFLNWNLNENIIKFQFQVHNNYYAWNSRILNFES